MMIDPNIYPTIWEHFLHPRNVGYIEDAAYKTVRLGSLERGNILNWQMKMDHNNASSNIKIVDVCYHTYGCGFQIAAASFLSEFLKGKDLQDIPHSIFDFLVEHLNLPSHKNYIAKVCEEATLKIVQKVRNEDAK